MPKYVKYHHVNVNINLSCIDIRARGAGGRGDCSPPDLGKTIIFWAKAKFFGQKPADKNEKSIFLYLLNEKNGIHSV